MNEYNTSSYGTATDTQSQGLESAAADFRTSVQDAASRMSSAAEQFITMSDGLNKALEEARAAADRAQAAQAAAEEMQQRLQHDYGAVSDLVRDLQIRIAALATLAQPWGTGQRSQSSESQPAEAEPAEEQASTTSFQSYESQEQPSETASPSW